MSGENHPCPSHDDTKRSGLVAALIWILTPKAGDQLHAQAASSPSKALPIPTEDDAEWASESVWTFGGGKKHLSPCRQLNDVARIFQPLTYSLHTRLTDSLIMPNNTLHLTNNAQWSADLLLLSHCNICDDFLYGGQTREVKLDTLLLHHN